ncbi:FtsX-like permease family protein [Clostridium sp. DJ247]|uniref:FtsX-like permease family protein n=1 Tax=Clostridium sp. DJ247 TaxID=2726188 RepID=UPI0016239DF9|nr:ABC transporter permease [Clostridium sp. DJ247]MBC2580070.1 ABC transporter permease [Clostridium sp. DJ247]
MSTFKIAWMLFKNNFKLYKFYLLVLTFTIAIYYNFLAISFNPYFSVLNEQYSFARAASILFSGVLFFTIIFFMTHANNFFYKLRYKEVGTYMLMGIVSSKLGGVFAVESMFLGSIAAVIGIPVGILFSKLFFMLLAKAMILNTQIPFYIPLKAISTLLLIFASIIFLLGLKNYWMVKKSKLIEILNAAKKEQNMPKMRWIRGALGVTSITTGYIIALNIIEWKIIFTNATIAILILICVGTYLFFGSFLSIILNICIKNKNLIYKYSRLISFSNTLFRLGTHYRSFAMTAILSAATLTAFSGALALKYYADANILMEAPYSINYMNQDEATNNKIKKIINDSSHKITIENQSHFIKIQISYNNGYMDVTKECLITSYSEIEKALEVTKPKNYKKILKQIKPQDNEIVSILHSKLLFSEKSYQGNSYVFQGNSYILKKEVKIPFIGEMPNIGQYETYVMTDKQYNKLRETKEEMILYGINFTSPQDSKELVMKIEAIMKNPRDNVNSYAAQYEYKYYLIGSFYFLGLVMAIVFMIATFSTIYFKILSDAILDREQYKMLMKIGMNKEETSKSIYTQVGIAFVLPALMGIMHGIMAIKALEAFMHSKFTLSILVGVFCFVSIMAVFYIFISRKYTNMVYER